MRGRPGNQGPRPTKRRFRGDGGRGGGSGSETSPLDNPPGGESGAAVVMMPSLVEPEGVRVSQRLSNARLLRRRRRGRNTRQRLFSARLISGRDGMKARCFRPAEGDDEEERRG